MEELKSLVPFVPEQYKGKVMALLIISPLITRALYALRNGGGLKGMLASIWLGTNTPKQKTETEPTKSTSTLPILFLAGVLAFTSGCARLKSVTVKETDKQGIQRERTQVSVITFWDANSELAKFKNSITDKTTGTTIGGINQESTSTNITSQFEAVASGFAAGVVKGLKP